MRRKDTRKSSQGIVWAGEILIFLEKILTFPLWLVRRFHQGWSSFYRFVLSRESVQRYRDLKRLVILFEVVRIFQRHGISYWVSGGYAYDALTGKLGRHHGDLDLVVNQTDLARVRELLAPKGYTFKEVVPTFWFARRHGEKVDFFTFCIEEDTVISRGLLSEIRYPRAFLEQSVEASLGGVSFQTFPEEALIFFAGLKPGSNQELLSRMPPQRVEIRKHPAKLQIIEAVVPRS